MIKTATINDKIPLFELTQYFLDSTRIFSKLRKTWKGKRKPVKELTEDEQLERDYKRLRSGVRIRSNKRGGGGSTSRREETCRECVYRTGECTCQQCYFCGAKYDGWDEHSKLCSAAETATDPLWAALNSPTTDPAGSTPTTPPETPAISKECSGIDQLVTDPTSVGEKYYCSCGEEVPNEYARCKYCIEMILLTEKLEKTKKQRKKRKKRVVNK